ncbi:MAG: response regulator [Acidobacteriaceae bacterium]|nr:response regulator [Acidobacteriaceae bacterium]MBV9295799.1 response regulator [Acidobacteriaceae bacterium]MBV9763919.1 response regulator [Acidobacteriaceae bacterium]
MAKLVVIVEDTESVASSLALAFENTLGVKAITTDDPRAALRLFRDPETPVAALVTDLNLPHLDGFELIREIRKLARYNNLPAIMITADARTSLGNGPAPSTPNAIFRKPFSLREVCRVLEELLK